MVFASPVFLFLFFPAFLLLYRLIPAKARCYWILAASLFFYFWGEPSYLLLMGATILATWLFGVITGLLLRKGKERLAGWVAGLGVLLVLSSLLYYKYAGLLATTLKDVFGIQWRLKRILMPIGISFYTFQAMSYLWDVRRKTIPAVMNPVKLGAYIAMFPQLIAGPIVRAGDVIADLDAPRMDLEHTWHGMLRFIRGLGKKVLLANSLAAVTGDAFGLPANSMSTGLVWFSALLYALQIYFDFSGYSDMAIGMGEAMGFRLPENFNFPYLAVSVRDFWRRWHMTLSSWLRDYVYIPLGGNRKGGFRTGMNLMIVFLVCGFWHGAQWNFVFWGLWYGLWMIIERIPAVRNKVMKAIPAPVRWLFTMAIVLIGWVLFQGLPMADTWVMLGRMIGIGGPAAYTAASILTPKLLIVLAASVVCASPLARIGLRKLESLAGAGSLILRGVLGAAVLAACILMLTADTYNPFIYFRF